jgi:hypothetical protein
LSKRGEVGAAVEDALKKGYRHIDCAHVYENEAEIGEVLQKCFNEGVIQRDSVFITSKLWYVGMYFLWSIRPIPHGSIMLYSVLYSFQSPIPAFSGCGMGPGRRLVWRVIISSLCT